MRLKSLKKIISLIATFAILFNAVAPYSVAIAQEITSTPTPTETSLPTPEATITPTDTASPTTQPDATPAEIASPTPEITPTPTDIVTPAPTDTSIATQAPESNPTVQGPPSDQPTSSPTATPTFTPVQPEKEGSLTAQVLETNLFSETLQENSWFNLVTDKLDYAPTEAAIITGSDFTPNSTYQLTVSSTDDPATSTTVDVTTDSNGSFVYTYQLDGIYRPNYKVEIKDAGMIVASTTFTDSASTTTTLSNIACVQDQPAAPSNLNCTANDISLASVSGITINGHGCRFPGDTVNFTANWQIQSNATSRYNVGLWFASGGQSSALHGSCSATSLPSSPTPFFDGGSSCGGINSGTPGTLNITMTATCNPDANGFLKLPYCTTWQQNSGSCTGPSQALPGSPSKCNCQDGFTVPITVPPSIDVVKVLSPSNDSGKFNLQVNGTTLATDIGDGGGTGKIGATIGANTIGETAGTSTTLSNYSSTVVCKDGHGTGNTVTTTGTNPWTLTATNGADILCTITNTVQNAHLTLVKTITNDNGGSAVNTAWTLVASGPTNISGVTGNASVTNATVNGGTYTLSELDGPTGYTASAYSCVKNGGQATVSNSITLAPGDNATCTVNNDDQAATLHIIKVVTNDNGGTKTFGDFNFQVNGGGAVAFEGDGQNDLIVNAGTYSVTEPSVTGYATTYSNCSNLVIPNGGSATCTITNNDVAPSLTLVKHIQNNDGGNNLATDWVLSATGTTTPISDNGGATSSADFMAGTYTLGETGPDGYIGNAWTCTGGSQNGNSITLSTGEVATCEITNDDIPASITLYKDVQNLFGGTAGINDFGLTIGGTSVISGQVLSVNSNTSFAINEEGLFGYDFVSLSGDDLCPAVLGGTLTLTEGQNISCTITNEDIQPQLTVTKIVDGGSAEVSDFNLFVDQTQVTSGSENGFNAGSYLVTETGDQTANYTASFSDDCNSDGSVTLAVGQVKSCTITNTRDTGNLQITKLIDADGDVNTTDDRTPAEGWVMDIDPDGQDTSDPSIPATNTSGTTSASGIKTGNYWVSEDTNGQTDNYHFLGSSCTLNNESTGTSGTSSFGGVVVAKDQTTYCTFINARDTGIVIVHKDVQGPNGEDVTDASNSFEVSLDGGTGEIISDNLTVTYYDVPTGSHTVTESLIDPDYTLYGIGISAGASGNTGGLTFTVTTGTNDVYVTNRQKTGTITVIKDVVTATGGPVSDTHSFTANLNPGTQSSPLAEGNNAVFTVNPGTYTVSETDDSKYLELGCLTATLKTDIPVASGQNVTITCTNQQNTGHIIIEKNAISDSDQEFTFNNNFGNSNPSTFGLTDDSTPGLPSYDAEVLPGTYSVSEDQVSGWQQENVTCDQGETIESIDVAPGETVTCTFTNEELATIVLVKNTVGGDETFNFDATGEGLPAGIDLTTSGNTASQTFTDLDQDNTYTISENVPAGWDLTSATCDQGETPDDIDLNAGETVTCTFTNTELGSVSGSKFEDLDGILGGDQNPVFDWLIELYKWIADDWSFLTSTNTDVNGFYSFSDLLPGLYQIREGTEVGWTNMSPLVIEENLSAGEDSTEINFVNTQYGSITVYKDVDFNGDGDLDDAEIDAIHAPGWTWNIDGTGNYSASEGDNTVENILPGNYIISEDQQEGYHITSLVCGETNYGAVEGQEISLASNQDLVCTFTNSRDTGDLEVTKYNDLDGNNQQDPGEEVLAGWEINLENQTSQITDINGQVLFNNLVTGSYELSETEQTGWTQTNISCQVGDSDQAGVLEDDEYYVNIESDQTTHCLIGNIRDTGNITVDKVTDPSEDTTEFTINLTGESAHDFVLSDTDSPETIAVPTGSYSLNEVAPNGWELSDISCVREVGEGLIALDESSFEIGSGNNISCTVTNTKVILGATIEKSNDKSDGAQAGNTVNYTLVVTNTGNQTIFNLDITDALPGGFSYVLGSTTGDTINDPTISGNNLIWEDVTNLEEGESITVHYQVKIASDVSVGTYKNIAGCTGDVRSQEETFECDPANSDVQVGQGQSFGGNLNPQVLGASTELPATGSPTALLALALGLLGTGFILKRKNAKN